MFTRCPQCRTVHALSASLLAHASGRVRCSRCDHAYFALGYLHDDWPRSDEQPSPVRVGAGPPILGVPSDPAAEIPLELPVSVPAGASDLNRITWLAMLGLLSLLTLSNLAWTFREEIRAMPFLQQARTEAPESGQPWQDPSLIHLVSRDLHQHPTLAGTLALSVVFVNRAPRAQPFPELSLTLTDAGDQPLAARTFYPQEYLPGGEVPEAGLAPGTHVPILLEFTDPGERATGFFIEFH